MVNICPHCGAWLGFEVRDGVAACGNCARVVDDGEVDRLLSAAWFCRRRHLLDADCLSELYGLSPSQVTLIQNQVIGKGLSHDGLIAHLRHTGASVRRKATRIESLGGFGRMSMW